MSKVKIGKIAKFRPEIEISGRLLVSGQKIHIFLAEKIFGQNARNFCPPATSKVKIFEKKSQNAKYENFSNGQNLAGDRNFWSIFGLRPENTYFFCQNNFWTKWQKFRTSSHLESKVLLKNGDLWHFEIWQKWP